MNPKVKVEELSSCLRRLTIEVPSQEVESEMERQFNALTKKVKLKGFREGHVPLEVIKQKFHEQVKGESLLRLVDVTYSKAISDHHLLPVSDPKVDLKSYEPGQSWEYTAEVEIKPTLTLKNYKGLSIEKEKVLIGKEQIDEAIERFRENKSQLKPVESDRGAQDKDHIIIDFKASLEGKVFPGGTAQNLLYEMGSSRFVPDLEEGFKGMKAGESKKIPVIFPQDFHEQKLAGKSAIFDVSLREIKMKELPMLDDQFSKEFEGCQTVSDLREKVKKDLEQVENDRVQKNLEKNLLEVLV